jgi:hypothetical protein
MRIRTRAQIPQGGGACVFAYACPCARVRVGTIVRERARPHMRMHMHAHPRMKMHSCSAMCMHTPAPARVRARTCELKCECECECECVCKGRRARGTRICICIRICCKRLCIGNYGARRFLCEQRNTQMHRHTQTHTPVLRSTFTVRMRRCVLAAQVCMRSAAVRIAIAEHERSFTGPC